MSPQVTIRNITTKCIRGVKRDHFKTEKAILPLRVIQAFSRLL